MLLTGLVTATATADPYQRHGEINGRDAAAEEIVINDAVYRLPAYVPVTGGSQQDLLPETYVGFNVNALDPNKIDALWLLSAPPEPSDN